MIRDLHFITQKDIEIVSLLLHYSRFILPRKVVVELLIASHKSKTILLQKGEMFTCLLYLILMKRTREFNKNPFKMNRFSFLGKNS